MTAALVALVICFLIFLRDRDIRTSRERELLLNRIQAPELAVPVSLEVPDDVPQWVSEFGDQERPPSPQE